MNKNTAIFKEFCDDKELIYEFYDLAGGEEAISFSHDINGVYIDAFVIFPQDNMLTTVFISNIFTLKDESKETEALKVINYLNLKHGLVKFAYDERDRSLMVFMRNLWDDDFKAQLTFEMMVVVLRTIEDEYDFLDDIFK